MATIAIHLVWTTYGTWLPGDQRGHWSPLFDLYGNLIERGGKLNSADLLTHKLALERMNEPPKVLSDEEIAVVAETIGSLVRKPSGASQDPDLPAAFAVTIEPTHVHLLLSPVNEPIGTAAGRFKGKSSSDVLAIPANSTRKRTWTAGFWKVFIFDAMVLAAVKHYIEEHNLRRGLPAAPYAWISPGEI